MTPKAFAVERDCSPMRNKYFMGGLSDPLECGREAAGRHIGECVAFIQRLYGSYYTNPGFRGYAGDIRPNTRTPAVGSAVLTKEGTKYHAALIYAIEGDELVLLESNMHGDGVVSFGRRIPIHSPKIRGYFVFKDVDISVDMWTTHIADNLEG